MYSQQLSTLYDFNHSVSNKNQTGTFCLLQKGATFLLAKGFKHLTLEDRVIIEDRLKNKKSFRSIAKDLGKSTSTIMREVRNYSYYVGPKGVDCSIKRDCNHRGLCGSKNCKDLCRSCKKTLCKNFCPDYIQIECDKLKQTPYVCNGCTSALNCGRKKLYYSATKAQKKYEEILTSKNAGFDLTKEQIDKVNELATPMLKSGCSPYHIKATYGEALPVSEITLRRMVNSCVLEARNLDLRDTVKRKIRKKTRNKDRIAKMNVSKVGHTYKDYLEYISNHEVNTVEMDCVEGKKNENEVLLTLHFKTWFMQLAFIMNEHTSSEVVRTLDKIEEALGTTLFQQMFPVILTDNGHEFADIEGMERSITGEKRTRIFFCEPNRSDEKGSCENHHRMIRWCIPKGESLKPFMQSDINLMMNHINSYKRKSLFEKSAYEVAKGIVPEDFFTLLGLEEIPADKITLNPSLFDK